MLHRRRIFDPISIITDTHSNASSINHAVDALEKVYSIDESKEPLHFAATEKEAKSIADNKAEFVELRKLLFSNPAVKKCIDYYHYNQENKNNKESKLALIYLRVELNRYRWLISYQHHYKENFGPKSDESGLKPVENAVNQMGVLTGEGAGTVLRLAEMINASTKFLTALHGLEQFFGPFSYFLYGLGALLSVPGKIATALKTHARISDAIPPPNSYPKANLFSAVANITVFFLYIAASFIFLSKIFVSFQPWVAFLDPLGIGGVSFGAIGTLIGWVGNNILDWWCARSEYAQLKDIEFSYPGCKSLVDRKEAEYHLQYDRMKTYSFMVLGMAFFAWASFLVEPVAVPLISSIVSISYPTFLGTLCFVWYAREGIVKALGWIGDKVKSCCCINGENKGNDIKKPPVKGDSLKFPKPEPEVSLTSTASSSQSNHVSSYGQGSNHNPRFPFASSSNAANQQVPPPPITLNTAPSNSVS
jgi:hypothetical protein